MQHGSHRLLSLSSAVVVVLLLGTVSFAGLRAYQFDALEATRVSPCLDLGRRLDAALPAGAAVLGPERWWWALHQHRSVSARSMWFQWVSIAANGQQPAVFARRGTAAGPDSVIVNNDVRDDIRDFPAALQTRFRQFIEQCTPLAADVDDPTYLDA